MINAVSLFRSLTTETMSIAGSLADNQPGVSLLWNFFVPGSSSGAEQSSVGQHVVVLLAGIFLVFGQAILVNRSLRTIKGLASAGYLPALFYIFFSAALGAGFNAPTVGAGFLLLAFNRLLRAYGPEPADSLLLEAGFWIGLASVTVATYLIFLPFALMMASNLRPIIVREFGVLLAGFLSVFILVISGIYVLDYWQDFLAFPWVFNPSFPDLRNLGGATILRTAIPVLVAIGALLTANQRNRKSLIQVRKLSSWTAVFGLFALFVWISGVGVAAAAVFPMAFFTAYWVQAGHWPKTWELAHLGLIALLLAGQMLGS